MLVENPPTYAICHSVQNDIVHVDLKVRIMSYSMGLWHIFLFYKDVFLRVQSKLFSLAACDGSNP